MVFKKCQALLLMMLGDRLTNTVYVLTLSLAQHVSIIYKVGKTMREKAHTGSYFSESCVYIHLILDQ